MATAPELDPPQVAELCGRVRDNIARAVKAPDDVLRDLLVALLAEGHVLIEDYPGVGKTALARALAASIDAESLGGKRITPKSPIPGMGWFAVFEDPTGNKVGLYTNDATAPAM